MLKIIKNFSITFSFTVISFFVIATLLAGFTAIGFQYYFSKQSAVEDSIVIYKESAQDVEGIINDINNDIESHAALLSKFLKFNNSKELVDDHAFELISSLLNTNIFYSSIYVSTDSGALFEVINLDAVKGIRAKFEAKPVDKWLKVSVTPSGDKNSRQRMDYIQTDGTVRLTKYSAITFNPSDKRWHLKLNQDKVHRSQPYILQSIKEPGISFSRVIDTQNAILGIDTAISSLTSKINKQKASKFSEIYIFDDNGVVIGSNIERDHSQNINTTKSNAFSPLQFTPMQAAYIKNNPVLKVSNDTDWQPYDFAVSGKPYGYAIDMLAIISDITGFDFEYVNGYSWNELVDLFNNGELDILQPVSSLYSRSPNGVLSQPFIPAPYGVVTQANQTNLMNVAELNGKRVAIPAGWSINATLRELYPKIEVVSVASIKDAIQMVKTGEVFAGVDNSLSLYYSVSDYYFDGLKIHEPLSFEPHQIKTDLHLVVQTDQIVLLSILNDAISKIPEDEIKRLELKWSSADRLNASGSQATVPYKSLIAKNRKLNQIFYDDINGVEHLVYITSLSEDGSRYFAAVSPMPKLLKPAMEKIKLSIIYTLLGILLLVPMCWIFANPITRPILQLAANAKMISKRDYKNTYKVVSPVVEIRQLADSMTAMMSSIQQHEESEKALLDSFIQLIAQAIDDKSPYTAGHCERVPQLALMLTNYASEHNEGPFKEFCFKTDAERREFHIAAWLHDCGKVTTPEHIVDKGTKLETIYNRIHEIRTRFEVLWRDAEIEALKNIIKTPLKEQEYIAKLNIQHETLKKDYAFVAGANVGGEFMSDEDISRLKSISKKQWYRNFDDGIGLSPVEEMRYSSKPTALPVIEFLLDDKPEHIIPRTGTAHHYDPSFEIKVDVPEHLYNLGEVYNLSISRGTLTTEDRFKINEHIISTIKMLETLPLPEELSRVPRYASTHHETLKGTGYPRRLKGDDLSIPERIMVLADIFEALTAADRPYKKAKPVSVAIDILHKMVLDQHVDPDVFNLFLSSGVYLDYAHAFLSQEQIDDVDISKYLQ